ncbi:MAG: hypothetical protein Ct9H300mP1_28510 [Planctomycetaceae bacterium]|nr:MAG: hypothetical protein Ct9H300mP1_28510 [Planctomycetaceae bacterium]
MIATTASSSRGAEPASTGTTAILLRAPQFPGRLPFLEIQSPVSVLVELFDQFPLLSHRPAGASSGTTEPSAFRRRWQLVLGDPAIAVPVEFSQYGRSVLDLLGRNFTVPVRVEWFHERRQSRRAVGSRKLAGISRWSSVCRLLGLQDRGGHARGSHDDEAHQGGQKLSHYGVVSEFRFTKRTTGLEVQPRHRVSIVSAALLSQKSRSRTKISENETDVGLSFRWK